ncbi:hypothetical protein LLQ46_11675 [Rouxiella badensis]|uniref:hypothetical protein n=1 Tax=Rouxiella badensis TaxID=1646377 RepID=UPI001B408207|nr:hypothetical protein [Rouxiella badensis]MCC3747508.1 hypothetical protein [Rouxiella badensis]
MKITSTDLLVIDIYSNHDRSWISRVSTAERCAAIIRRSEEVVEIYLRWARQL